MSDKKNPIKDYIKYAGVGFEILACILLFSGAGYFLDNYFQPSKPWFLLSGSLIGCGLAIYFMIKRIK